MEYRLLAGGFPPHQATSGAGGFDLRAPRDILVARGAEPLKVDLRIEAAVPDGCIGMMCSRSGLAAQGLNVFNSPGIIDADYRGELATLLQYWGPDESFRVEKGQRICQLVIVPIFGVVPIQVSGLSATQRGGGGFGSTGLD